MKDPSTSARRMITTATMQARERMIMNGAIHATSFCCGGKSICLPAIPVSSRLCARVGGDDRGRGHDGRGRAVERAGRLEQRRLAGELPVLENDEADEGREHDRDAE